MRKGILIVIMIGICIVYFFSFKIRNEVLRQSSNSINIEEKLASYESQLLDAYPTAAQEVVRMYGDIIAIYYRGQMKEVYIEKYVDVVRMFYSQEINTLNTRQEQIEQLKLELMAAKDNPIILLKTEILETHHVNEDSDTIVKVKHFTNKNDIERSYYLKKQNGKWKITSWEDKKTDKETNKVEAEE